LFLLAAPGVVAGVVPWLITRWHARRHGPLWLPSRALGVVLIVAGAAAVLHSFARFVREGSGTPAPVAPTNQLVVGGLYRYVRNPMYVGVAAVVLGQAGVLVEPVLVVYTAVFVTVVTLFVFTYEEPTLRRQFGREYEDYCRAVPRWLPRRSPWHPGGLDRAHDSPPT